MNTLLKNARIVLKDEIVFGDLLIEGKFIKKIGKNLSYANVEVVDVENKYVLPGFIDLNCV